MIEVEGVDVDHAGGIAALRSIAFRAAPGEFVAVIGPSGAGKSTLLRALNGLAPARGRIRIGDVQLGPRTLRLVRRQAAMVFQNAALVPRATVLANVLAGALRELGFWRTLAGWWPRAVQVRACALLAEVGLREEHLYRRADSLSGGEQQRVGIARALMAGPRVLLADEPVASLDPVTSREILGVLGRAAREHGCTVVCSLHQIELARLHADRVLALRAGRIVWDAPAGRLGEAEVASIYERR